MDGKWENLESIEAAHLLELIKPEAEKDLVRAGAYFAKELKLTLSHPGSGLVYNRGRSRAARKAHRSVGVWVPAKFFHQASRPGEPPAPDTGALRNSIGFSAPVWSGLMASLEVGTGLGQSFNGPNPSDAYARILEWGGVTSRGVRILARPYMEPTALRAEPMIERLLAGERAA